MQIFGILRSEKKETGMWSELGRKYKLMADKGAMRLDMPQGVPFVLSLHFYLHQQPLRQVIFVEKRKMISKEH